jgi:hypothetical protein
MIGDEGARALTTALARNTSVTTLIMDLNEITDEGARALAKMLVTNTSVVMLSVNYNEIGNEGARALANALVTNTSLTTLSVHTNRIDADGADALATALDTNQSVIALDVHQNFFGAAQERSLDRLTVRNTAITLEKKLRYLVVQRGSPFWKLAREQRVKVIRDAATKILATATRFRRFENDDAKRLQKIVDRIVATADALVAPK